MMGAVRRWYDTVTAQLASLTSALAGYLPLSGGTVTGTLSANVYQLSGVAFAHRDAAVNYHYIYDADGADPALILGGAASGYGNLYRAEAHTFQSNNGALTFATLSAGGLSAPAGLFTAGGVSASGNVNGNVLTGNAVNSNGGMTATGNVTAANLISNGNLTVAGGGNIVGTLTAGAFSSNLMIATNLDAADVDCTGNIEAVSYTRGGVPMVMLTQAQFDRIEARIAALERARVVA
jgi:hypothetical protein